MVLASYVDKFKYLGHIINDELSDDEDTFREIKNLAIRGDVLLRRFTVCINEMMYPLFFAYCYQIYGCQLWTRCRVHLFLNANVCSLQ